jgi:hypothetical protein
MVEVVDVVATFDDGLWVFEMVQVILTVLPVKL